MARQWEQVSEIVYLLLIESGNPAATPPPAPPFGGPVTLLVTRNALAEDPSLG